MEGQPATQPDDGNDEFQVTLKHNSKSTMIQNKRSLSRENNHLQNLVAKEKLRQTSYDVQKPMSNSGGSNPFTSSKVQEVQQLIYNK